MRILFTRFPLESAFGGAEIQTLTLMREFAKRGHDVEFLGSCSVLLDKVTSYELRVTNLDIGPPPVTKWGAVNFLWRKKKMQHALIKELQTTNYKLPTVICMLSLSEKLLLTEWATSRGIRVVWIEHDRVGRWLRWNPWLAKLRALSRLATTVVVSELSKKIYLDLGWRPEHLIAIKNGIDVERLAAGCHGEPVPQGPPGEPSRGETTGMLHVGTVARLSPEKGVDLLIEAIATMPDVRLTIVGQGPQEEPLRRLIARRGFGERVQIFPTTDDIGAFYRSLDVFILPSREHDPCPLAPMEAMSLGVATILTDACGTADYVRNAIDAIIVPANSDEALRKALVTMEDPFVRERIAASGKARAAEAFSLQVMVDSYLKIMV